MAVDRTLPRLLRQPRPGPTAARPARRRDDRAVARSPSAAACRRADLEHPRPSVGDDPTGCFSESELLDAAGNRVRIRRARNLTEAGRLLTDDVTCIMLDLHLPPDANGDASDGTGLGTLHELVQMAPTTAVLALAGGVDDAELAAEAVRVGAQDYLFRDELDASLLNRAMRYAVERKRADLADLQLTESHLLTQENARLERGLLPTPLLGGAEDLRFSALYRPRPQPRTARRRPDLGERRDRSMSATCPCYIFLFVT